MNISFKGSSLEECNIYYVYDFVDIITVDTEEDQTPKYVILLS